MIKSLFTLLTALVLGSMNLALHTAQAAEVNVTWTDPDKYRDIDAGTEGRKRFQENMFSEFEKHLSKLAKALPVSQTLNIEVTDIDLAGDVLASGLHQIRVIKDLYFPRIKLSFTLINAEKAIILSDNVNLKDMNFMMGGRLKYRNNALGYEKKLLDDWFKDVFANYVDK
ncbi:DUF3016 domain-containing protein [Colwellia hornerae]|uniref:DUF3016 domain-containing protein n=1 Tax=Colwellia hornerae TaxID=89402 RepID=A0A5C6QBK7_9GAMM|nr:DUF3016 domain-containing protein [Colwellia hornerae]TWX55166.1 DUF3016 domain-containing protein [Colwellia hornerae]TWX61166.1 DUF3016 domain-containing protein [Colwellia hornerae]TWX66484.1 DUF3016 domain-containing protein [Colwellia hornerae]